MSKKGKETKEISLSLHNSMIEALEEEKIKLKLRNIQSVIKKILSDHFSESH
jgi:hypothetical protein